MLNPDGVYLGNYRCSLMGFDLNRHWLDPSPWAHPTLHGVKQLIIQMYNDPKTSLEFYIDIHAHSTMMNGFMYGNIFEDEERFQRQAVFPKLLCQNAEDFSYSSTSFNRDAVKAGTGRRFLGGLLDHTSYCYTLEVSFYSYIIGGTTAAVPYTEEASAKAACPAGHAACLGFLIHQYFPQDDKCPANKRRQLPTLSETGPVAEVAAVPGVLMCLERQEVGVVAGKMKDRT
uniref:BEN domain containing 5 n=1 Tax=Bos mutus grunniens TaxID=30521 RepID=A0A8B9VZL1_BOSMU